MRKISLNGKTVLITGASSGIGKATAKALAHEGVNLILVSRNFEKLTEVENEIKHPGIRTLSLKGDITNHDEMNNVIKTALSQFGNIDVIICNAGIYYRHSAVDIPIDEVRKVMETNFYGTLNCIYRMLPHFRDKNSGHIVVVTSLDGKKGLPMDSAYVASKFALTGFMESLRQDLYGTSIHVSTILPGRIDTPMTEILWTPKITPKISPNFVATAIVKAIIHKKKEVIVPYLLSKSFLIMNCLSASFGDWFIRVFKVQGEELKEQKV